MFDYESEASGGLSSLVSSLRELGLLSYSGRIGRRDYWLAMGRAHLVLVVGSFLVRMLMWLVFGFPTARLDLPGRSLGLLISTVGLVVLAAYFWLGSAALVKRLHDLNLSGRLGHIYPAFFILTLTNEILFHSVLIGVLAGVVFMIGLISFFGLGAVKDTNGPNRFGSDPLAVVGAGGLHMSEP